MASNKTYNGIDLIEQLLFIETKKGEFRGFKQDFLLTNLNEVEKEFYVCTKCNGIMRNACRIGEEELLVCELCSSKEDKSQAMVKSRKKILELRTKCPLERRGCSWKGTTAEIKTHLDVCLEFIMNCTNKCDVIMKRSDLTNHCKSECQNRDINCKHCNVRMKFKMLEDHYKTCTEISLLCPNECKRTFTRKEVELHVNNECPNTLLNCENECGRKIKRSEMQNHYKNACQNRKIHCKHCSVIIQYKEKDTHNGTCPEFPLLCPNECKRTFTRKEVELHVNNECVNTLLNCENECGLKLKRSKMQNHYKNECQNRKIHCIQCSVIIQYKEIDTHNGTCPEFPLLCPNECLKNPIRKEIDSHIENDCPNTVIECPYRKMGCEAVMKRCEIVEHEKISESKHLKITANKVEKLESENYHLKTKIQELIENVSYPVVLRNEIAKEYYENVRRDKWLSLLPRLNYQGYFNWNRQKLQLCLGDQLNIKEFHFTIRIPYDKRKLEHINWPVNCKLTIHDIQSTHNSLVFESQIQEFKPPSEKNRRPGEKIYYEEFSLAKVLKAQLCEERFRNGNDAVSFTLQMKDVNYFPCW